jgi:hypothetical protein
MRKRAVARAYCDSCKLILLPMGHRIFRIGSCGSGHHCQQLGDLLRVAGGVGSDATAEAIYGYRSNAAFSNFIREETGLSPSVWRERG